MSDVKFEAPEIYVLDEGPVTTQKQFSELVGHAVNLLPTQPVVVIPRGVIDVTFLELDAHSKVENVIGGAPPHTHDEPTCLISDGSVRTSTLIFNAMETALATIELLEAGWRKIIENMLTKVPKDWRLQECLEAGIAGLKRNLEKEMLHVRNVPQNTESSNSFCDIRNVIANLPYEDTATAYTFIAELQASIRATRVIEWQHTDALFFRGDMVHGRDARQTSGRGSDEGLHMIMRGVRRTHSK